MPLARFLCHHLLALAPSLAAVNSPSACQIAALEAAGQTAVNDVLRGGLRKHSQGEFRGAGAAHTVAATNRRDQLGANGARPIGRIDQPRRLTTHTPDHPYTVADCDLPDRG